jgi:hypothetical protein
MEKTFEEKTRLSENLKVGDQLMVAGRNVEILEITKNPQTDVILHLSVMIPDIGEDLWMVLLIPRGTGVTVSK